MMVTFTKTAKTVVNPFDDTEEDVIEAAPSIDGVALPKELFTFAAGTTDEAIQTAIETALTAKGYALGS